MAGAPYDQRERWDDPEEATRMALEAHRSDIWTALPVIFKSHDRDKNTVHVQPTVKLKHVKADGSSEWREFPTLEDVPVHYPGGGGMSMTFPIKDGDEGLVIFASRNIDKWWQEGGVQEQPAPFRMHDISDGFAIPGFRSQPRKLGNVSATTSQIRTDDGSMYIDFDPVNKKYTIHSMDNPVRIEGDLEVTGDIVWFKGTGGDTRASTHKHTEVMKGGQLSGKPQTGT